MSGSPLGGRVPEAPLPPGHGVAHQPDWSQDLHLARTVRALAASRPLVQPHEVRRLREQLAAAARGELIVLQAGDCAESLDEAEPRQVNRRLGTLLGLASRMSDVTDRPVVAVGRMAGQYAKPRSSPTEVVAGVEMSTFRGHLVNDPAPHSQARRHRPSRMLVAHRASGRVMHRLRHVRQSPSSGRILGPWSSHEALVLDYELPQVRRTGLGDGHYLASTHWPWIGDRTRTADGAHVATLAALENPVAVKVGPRATPEEVAALAERLDPHRSAGRLTFVLRLGAGAVAEVLPPLARAVREQGHPVLWLNDPLHGNTVTTRSGLKTRHVQTVLEEVDAVHDVLASEGLQLGGLHLESAGWHVEECVDPGGDPEALGPRYESLCDPRLSPAQAGLVVRSFPSATRRLSRAA